MKKIKFQIALDIIMIVVSLIMTLLYVQLILTEDVLIGKKVITIIWAIQIVIWSIKLWFDLNHRKLVNK